jgi:hypothetical protein
METVQLHWYDELSKEGMFRTGEGKLVFANFEGSEYSHVLARKLKNGDKCFARVVRDSTFEQIDLIAWRAV